MQSLAVLVYTVIDIYTWIVIASAIACRENVPSGDPKTPANSPIPNIDRKESDPKGPPSPSIADAG